MAKKWADYLISGVWFSEKNGSKYISYVQIHKDSETGVLKGEKKSEVDVIKLLKVGFTIKTIIWNYNSGAWNEGADVGYEIVGGKEYLRTHKDKTVINNLNNMLNMGWLL